MVRCAADRRAAARVTGYDVVRIVLGLVLLSAAVLKGHQLATEPVVATGLLTSRWFLIGVVGFELFFGFWLWFGLYPRQTWAVALACFSCFAAVCLAKGISGEASCGCFGRATADPWHVLGLDMAAITALLCFRPVSLPSGSALRSVNVRLRVAGVVLLWFAGGGAIAWGAFSLDGDLASGRGVIRRGGLVILQPERWVGSEFPLLPHTDLGGQLAQGDWTVMLYHQDCDTCREAILQSEEASPGERNGRLALVEVPPCAGVNARLRSLLGDRDYRYGRLDESVEWFVETPVVVELRRGVVVDVTGPRDLQGDEQGGSG